MIKKTTTKLFFYKTLFGTSNCGTIYENNEVSLHYYNYYELIDLINKELPKINKFLILLKWKGHV